MALAKKRNEDEDIRKDLTIRVEQEKYGDLLVIFKMWKDMGLDLQREVEHKLWKAMKNVYEIQEKLYPFYKALKPSIIGFLIEKFFEMEENVLVLPEKRKITLFEKEEEETFKAWEEWGFKTFILYKTYQGLSEEMQFKHI